MAIKTSTELKAYFETGDIPTQSEFIDLIDSTYKGYNVYTAILTQSGTSAPTATVLQNTLGTVTITYTAVGTYLITASGAFPVEAKVFVLFGGSTINQNYDGTINTCIPKHYYNNANSLGIVTYKHDMNGTPPIDNGQLANDLLIGQMIEIRVYN